MMRSGLPSTPDEPQPATAGDAMNLMIECETALAQPFTTGMPMNSPIWRERLWAIANRVRDMEEDGDK